MSVRALAVLAAVILGVLAAPSAAQADPVTLLDCTGWQDVSYSPPLTNTETSTLQSVDARFGTSALPLGLCLTVGSTITGGGYTTSFTSLRSCLELAVASGEPVTRAYSWNDATTSTVSTTRRVERTEGTTVITFEGTVTAGHFAGATIVETLVAVNPNPLICATTGVSSLHFTDEVLILSD
ncbi:hypothetical protein [Hamadaea tsunoensis]|uniref:hypothetical protein n=1 Tax=Hamadaea tsunoensis TaxID=53368 RepID=UPI0004278B8C|nr:hypothetical protein [Hamadaea tsunoensis]